MAAVKTFPRSERVSFVWLMPVAKAGIPLPAPFFPGRYSKRNFHLHLPAPRRRTVRARVLTLLARFLASMRYPYFVESNLRPPDGITSQDLLS